MSLEASLTAEPLAAEPLNAERQPEPRGGALIGPHAVIHLAETMAQRLGPAANAAVLASARIAAVPGTAAMIPESEALLLHRALLIREPVQGLAIAREAARRTADYIIANRIPAPAAALLCVLPAQLAAPLLMHAIGRHAWTFIGAGAFRPHSAWAFTIDRTGAGDAIPVPGSTFEWYGAVFERLYQRLVAPDCRVEIAPVRVASEPVRRFRLIRTRQRG